MHHLHQPCACGSSGSSTTVEEKSPEELVRTAVESRGRVEYIGSKIGDKDLKSSHAVITNIASVSDTEYRVSGRMILTDVYGDDWENTFDCTVTQDSSGNWN